VRVSEGERYRGILLGGDLREFGVLGFEFHEEERRKMWPSFILSLPYYEKVLFLLLLYFYFIK